MYVCNDCSKSSSGRKTSNGGLAAPDGWIGKGSFFNKIYFCSNRCLRNSELGNTNNNINQNNSNSSEISSQNESVKTPEQIRAEIELEETRARIKNEERERVKIETQIHKKARLEKIQELRRENKKIKVFLYENFGFILDYLKANS